MGKVTSKYQITLPRRIARAHRIAPGTEIDFESAGSAIRLQVRAASQGEEDARAAGLERFDAATRRVRERQAEVLRRVGGAPRDGGRGWSRAALYEERTRSRGTAG